MDGDDLHTVRDDIPERIAELMTGIQGYNNRELAGTALDCLHELKRRGNKSLDSAIKTVSLFHYNLITLQEMANALEGLPDFEEEPEYINDQSKS